MKSDADHLLATLRPEPNPTNMNGNGNGGGGPGGGGGGGAARKHKALCVSFTLPKSCYATMCLRELTKQSMSVAHHTNISG